MERILKRAEARIEAAIYSSIKNRPHTTDEAEIDDVEIPSFPIAMMMVASSKDSQLKRRFALAEAKRASSQLRRERAEKIAAIADLFGWKIRATRLTARSVTYNFALHFADYVKNSASIQDAKWKLVNRLLLNGEVYITQNEATRLLEEEVHRHIEDKLNIEVGKLSKGMVERVEKLKGLLSETRGKTQFEEIPSQTVLEAFPPCMRQLYEMAPSGRHISHTGRFALTSFLINSGMPSESIIEHFRPTSDFSEKMTRYQVEHIAGGRGSRTKYIPPRCDVLRTHGICPGTDDTCRIVRHPLAYYKRKLKTLKKQTSAPPH